MDKQLTKKKRGKKWKRCQIIGKNRKTIGSNRKREEISKTVRKDGTIRNWKAMATQHFLMYHLETVPTAGHGPSILA